MVRLTYQLLGPDLPLELFVHADDLDARGAGKRGRRACLWAFAVIARIGFPLDAPKPRGGLKADWPGDSHRAPDLMDGALPGAVRLAGGVDHRHS